jgi:hypothetical protein
MPCCFCRAVSTRTPLSQPTSQRACSQCRAMRWPGPGPALSGQCCPAPIHCCTRQRRHAPAQGNCSWRLLCRWQPGPTWHTCGSIRCGAGAGRVSACVLAHMLTAAAQNPRQRAA